MKKLFSIITILLIGLSQVGWGTAMVGASNKKASGGGGGDGFVGNNTVANDTVGDGGRDEIQFSLFTPTSSGDISYMHCRGQATIDSANSAMAIYDSSYNRLAYTEKFTTQTDARYSVALNTTISISTENQYYLAWGTGDDTYWTFAATTGGDTYEDDNGWDGDVDTELPDPIVNDSTRDANATMCIWATNTADGS